MCSQAHQSYEVQVANVTSSVVNMESELDRLRAERSSLQHDLKSVRDLNAKLDSSKENIARQLAARNVENEQVCVILILLGIYASYSFVGLVKSV